MNDLAIDLKKRPQQRVPSYNLPAKNGTGKEMVAQLFLYYSSRQDKSMVAFNYGAIPLDLVESEFFGREMPLPVPSLKGSLF